MEIKEKLHRKAEKNGTKSLMRYQKMSPEKICKFARKFETRRGDAILCFRNHAEKEMLIFINFPDKISNIPYCVATHKFSTGHSTLDHWIDLNEMYECSFRIEGK